MLLESRGDNRCAMANAAASRMPHVLQFDCYEADLDSGELRKRGIRLALRAQSFQVLALLLEHPGQVVTREELRQQLWRDEVFVDFEKGLNTAVSRVREALNDSAEHPHFIETLPKRGYRFIAAVHTPATPSPQPRPGRARLLILPFLNLSGDPAQDYFSDAMTDEIITAVATVAPEQLAVIARTTAMHYKNTQKDVAEIGRDLTVQYVIEGAVRRSEDQVDINVQLIQTCDQAHLFAKRYSAEMRTVCDALNDIARRIAAHIPGMEQASLAEADGRRTRLKPTEDVVAYNLYLKGRHHLRQMTPPDIDQGQQLFEQAIARDPRFALAHFGVAEAYWVRGFMGLMRPKDAFSAGVFAALRSVELDPTLAQAHAQLGTYRKELDYNWPAVHREMTLALELDPDSPDVLFCYAASDLMAQGHIEESIVAMERALELDPLSGFIRAWLGLVLYLGRQYERALEQLELSIELYPTYFFSYSIIGLIRCEERRFEDSIAVLEKAAQLSHDSQMVLGWLGMTLAKSGDASGARKLLAQFKTVATYAYVLPTSFAWIHLGLGEIDHAYSWLERAIEDRDPIIIPIKTYPYLDPLRSDLPFGALLRKMKLES